jgi:hypothetical protein
MLACCRQPSQIEVSLLQVSTLRFIYIYIKKLYNTIKLSICRANILHLAKIVVFYKNYTILTDVN